MPLAIWLKNKAENNTNTFKLARPEESYNKDTIYTSVGKVWAIPGDSEAPG